MNRTSGFGMRRLAVSLSCFFGIGLGSGIALTVPPSTALPVVFTRTLDSGKAKAGDTVTAKTMQVVLLPGGEQIPKGSLLVGHVVESRSFVFDPTPYAAQQPSYLSIHFDTIAVQGRSIPLDLSVRALANRNDAYEASMPRRTDDTDTLGTMVLIGGDHFSPIGKEVRSSDDEDIVGYNRKQGVFAHLLPGVYAGRSAGFRCEGTSTEQSVAIFSADACGLYGFVDDDLAEPGSGTFRLEARHHTVKLYGGSAALLQVVDAQ